jgi:hypothetical protein
MLNKKDPLIDAIQQVMQSNQADRDAVKAVNEKFGIQDRKVLPHERQGEWDAAYQTVLSEGVEALDEKSFAALAPPYDKATHKDKLVGAGVLKKHPTKPGKHILAKEEKKMKSDDPCWDNYEMIGMKKGKGGKEVPNCVPVKEQMADPYAEGQASSITTVKSKTPAPAEPKPVGQADQRKLKTMIQNIKEAKKAAMYEGGMEKTMGEFKRGKLHSGSKTGPIVKSREQAIAIGMNNEETVSENINPMMNGAFPKANFGGMPRQDAAGRARKDRGDKPGTGPGQGSGAPQSRTADGKEPLPPKTTSANNNAPPAVGGARPSVVAKNSYSGAQTSTGAQVGGARPSVVAKNLPSQKPYQSGAGAMTNPTQRPYDAKTSPTAKAPATTRSKVIKPVRKQPTTGTAKPASGGVPTRPVKKNNVLDRVKANRQRDKNNDVGP